MYAVPAVKPDTVTGLEAAEPVTEPGVDIAVKVVAAPPVTAGVNATDAERTPAVAVGVPGASTTS